MAAENMKSINSHKYGYVPNAIEEKAVETEKLREVYDLYRLVIVKEDAERYEHADAKKGKMLWKKLREPLKIGGKLLALAECLKRKDAPGSLYKSTTESISFFNREQVIIARKIIKIFNICHYWIVKEGEDKVIDKRFLMQELCIK